jgi:BTB/POZ domain-containing protein 1/2
LKVKRWAQEKCRQRNLPSTAEHQRNVLGNALYLIRFPLINPTDFAKHVGQFGCLLPDSFKDTVFLAPTKLLSDAEMVSVFLYYHTGPQQPLPFSLSYRGLYTPEMIVNRFQRVESSWGYTGTPDRVKYVILIFHRTNNAFHLTFIITSRKHINY